MDPDAVVVQPGLAAVDGWARRSATLAPGVVVLVIVVWAMYRLLWRSQAVAVPELVFLPLGLAMVALLMLAAVGFVLVLEGSVAAEHARRSAPVDLRMEGTEVKVVGGPLDGRRLSAAERASARLEERKRPGRGVWRNLKDVVLQRKKDRVPDEAYLVLVLDLDGGERVLGEATTEPARASLRAVHGWLTGTRRKHGAGATPYRDGGVSVAPDHERAGVASASVLARRLLLARVAMAVAYPLVVLVAWLVEAPRSLLSGGLVLAAGLGWIGLWWALVRPGALARAAAHEEMGASKAQEPRAWRRARARAFQLSVGGMLAFAASVAGLALPAASRRSADEGACAAGDHAACTRQARAMAARDPAGAIALLAPACTPPIAAEVPRLRRCEALAATLLAAPAPHRDAARAEALYLATCTAGSDTGCTLRRALCKRETSLPGCATVTPEAPLPRSP